MGPNLACLVVTGEAVMAQDLALTLSDRYGGVDVLVARSPAEALDRLSPVDSLLVAVADLSPAHWAAHPLAVAVSDRGGRVVLITEEKGSPDMPWELLDRPFRSAALRRILPPRP